MYDTRHVTEHNGRQPWASRNKRKKQPKRKEEIRERDVVKNNNTSATEYTSNDFSPNVINKIRSLNRDGKRGKDVVEEYLPLYNEERGKKITIDTLKKDEDILDVIDFIERTPPKSMR